MPTKPYPIYEQDQPEKPGMYLGLFHGRKTESESLTDWGERGPLIGPIKWCHTTYFGHMRIQFIEGADFRKYGFTGSDPDFCIGKSGLIAFNGMFYGDWTVFYHAPDHANQ